MQLVKYEAACKAVSEALTADEAKSIRDKAAAMKAYARMAKNKTLRLEASEIEFRAERRLGEIIIQQKETVGLNRGAAGGGKKEAPRGAYTEPRDTAPTLAEAGIDKKLSSRAQALARISEEDFEAELAAHRESQQEITRGTMERLAGRAHVANNSGEHEWYTPPEIIHAARAVMGGIDLDPASSHAANVTVGAGAYYTAKDDGLARSWRGRVWINPPYSQPLIGKFVNKLITHIADGGVSTACALVNNATETEFGQNLLLSCSAVCFPKGRIRFIDKDGKPSGAPLQGQMITYYGDNVRGFLTEFGRFGACFNG